MGFDASAAFAYLDNAEEALDGLQGWLDNTFASIETYGQEGVDAICQWAGEWVSYKIAQIEAQVVKGLHGAYQGAIDHLAIGGPIYNLVTGGVSADLGALVTGLLKIAMPWVPPTLAAIQTMVQVPIKVVSIAGKVANLASYRPPLTTPGITLDAFQIKPKSISMGDIITGNFTVPDPPEPFTTYMKQSVARTKEKIAKEREEAGQTTSFKTAVGITSKVTTSTEDSVSITDDGTTLA